MDLRNPFVTNEKVMGQRESLFIVELTISMLFWIYVVELISLPEKGSNVM